MKKIKVVVELSDENFEVLRSGDPADFDDPSGLLYDLRESLVSGDFELVAGETES